MSRSGGAGHGSLKAVVLGSAAVLVFVGCFSMNAFGAAYQLDGLGASCTEPGNSNTVHGNGFTPGSSVGVVVGSNQIGALPASSGGIVDGGFTIPASAAQGNTTLMLVGTGQHGPRTLSFDLQVGNCSGAQVEGIGVTEGGSTGGTGALAFTGGNVGMTVGIAAAALVLGISLFAASKKRKQAEAERVS